MTTTIPTPRMDAFVRTHNAKRYSSYLEPQLIEHAKILERKLAHANAQIAALQELLEVARNALFGYANSFGARNFTDRYGDADRCNRIVAAIDAARKEQK